MASKFKLHLKPLGAVVVDRPRRRTDRQRHYFAGNGKGKAPGRRNPRHRPRRRDGRRQTHSAWTSRRATPCCTPSTPPEVKIEDKKLLILKESDILAIVEK